MTPADPLNLLWQVAQGQIPVEDDLDAEQNAANFAAVDAVKPPGASDVAKAQSGNPNDKLVNPGNKPTSAEINQPLSVSPAVDGAMPMFGTARQIGAADDELAQLQNKSKGNKSLYRLGQAVADFTERPTNALDYAMRLGGGGASAPPPKNTMWQDMAKDDDADIAALMQRRKADSDMAATAEEMDPASPTANAYRAVLTKFYPALGEQLKGANAKQMKTIAPWVEKQSAEANALEKARLATQNKAPIDYTPIKQAELELKEKALEEAIRRHKAQEGAAARVAATKAAETGKGRVIAPTVLTDLADAQTAIRELGPLGQKFSDLNMSGPVAKASGVITDALDLQWTDAAEFKAAAQRAMQGVGKIMEGGKLAASDETKYRQMLPRAGDPVKLAQQKINESQAFLRHLIEERVKVLKAAGYDVPDIGQGEAQPATAPGQSKLRKVRLPDGEIVMVR